MAPSIKYVSTFLAIFDPLPPMSATVGISPPPPKKYVSIFQILTPPLPSICTPFYCSILAILWDYISHYICTTDCLNWGFTVLFKYKYFWLNGTFEFQFSLIFYNKKCWRQHFRYPPPPMSANVSIPDTPPPSKILTYFMDGPYEWWIFMSAQPLPNGSFE